MEILVIPDSFKGSLSAMEVAQVMAKTVKKVFPSSNCLSIPFSDGGEGALNVLASNIKGTFVECSTYDALKRPIKATYFTFENQKSVWIELSQTAGITQLKQSELQPLKTSTWGTGKMIKDALSVGCKTIYLGIGGSATQDLGTGIISALGGRFLDENDKELPEGGGELYRLKKIDLSNLSKKAIQCKWVIACDVQNPLTGKRGTAKIYAKQKGASDKDIELLEKGGRRFIKVVKKEFGIDINTLKFGGAAGGVGAGLYALLNASLENGFEILAELIGLSKKMTKMDLILTGEGSFDKQSFFGKLPAQVATLSQKKGVPCLIIVGKAIVKKIEGLNMCKIIECKPADSSIDEAMKNAKINLEQTITKELYQIKNNKT